MVSASTEPDVVLAQLPHPDSGKYAHQFARLRREFGSAEDFDPHSSMVRLPTAEELAAAFESGEIGLVAQTRTNALAGYGLSRSWTEDDGTTIHLLDCWAVPDAKRTSVEGELFTRLEALVRGARSEDPRAVLGANARSTEPDRARLLTELGFRAVFDMVEMELPSLHLNRPSLPAGIQMRTARVDDAWAIANLTDRVWAGRPFYSATSLADTRRWLSQVDPQLCLIAEDASQMIGLVSANVNSRCAEIDDVQVDPGSQRRGVATALVSELVHRLRECTAQPIRLHTEGHDPAGARSLYERLGFNVVSTHHRYRKPLVRTSVKNHQ